MSVSQAVNRATAGFSVSTFRFVSFRVGIGLPILGYRLATKLSEITGNSGIDDVKQYFKKSDA